MPSTIFLTTVVLASASLAAAAPLPHGNGLLGLSPLPLLRGKHTIIKKSPTPGLDILGPLDDALLEPVNDLLEPVVAPLEPVLKPLGSVLGVDIDLLTPTDLLCAKVAGEFVGKAYALGCVCLGQDGLLLTAEAGVQVVDGLIDWVTAEVNASGFTSRYPEYGIPTCERKMDGDDEDEGEFRCPLGKERKANGTCAPIFLASIPPSSAPSSAGPTSGPTSAAASSFGAASVSSAPSASQSSPSDNGSGSASGSAPAPTGLGANSAAPAPSASSPAPASNPGGQAAGPSASPSGSRAAGPAPSSSGSGSGAAPNGPVNIASTPVGNGNNGGNNNGGDNDSSNDNDGEDLPFCDEDGEEGVYATGADGTPDGGEGEWVQVQSVTSTETVTIPATAYIQQETVTQTTTTTSTRTATTTVTTTSTSVSTATVTQTQTQTQTIHDCDQSFDAAAIPGPSAAPAPASAPAPSRASSASAAVVSSAAIAVASASAAASASASSTAAPTVAPASVGPAPSSASATATSSASEDDSAFRPNGARLNARPHSSSSAAPPCPSGQVMAATQCCPIGMIERNGDCGCLDGQEFLLGACVEICLPPLQLIDGQCIKLDLGVATDLVEKVGGTVDGLTKDLGLGGVTDSLGLGGLL